MKNPIKSGLALVRSFLGGWKSMVSRNFETSKEGTGLVRDAYTRAKNAKKTNG